MTVSAYRTVAIGVPNRYGTYGILPGAPSYRWPTAQPGDNLDYSVDITRVLEDSDDALLSAALSLKPSGSGEMQALDLSVSGNVVTTHLTGGVPGRPYVARLTLGFVSSAALEVGIGVDVSWLFSTGAFVSPPSRGFGTPVTWAANGTLTAFGQYLALSTLGQWPLSDSGILPGGFYAASMPAPAYIYAVPGFGQIPGPPIFYDEITGAELLAMGAYPLPQTDPHRVKQVWLNGNIACASLG